MNKCLYGAGREGMCTMKGANLKCISTISIRQVYKGSCKATIEKTNTKKSNLGGQFSSLLGIGTNH